MVNQRLRAAVVRIAKTADHETSSLLEKSLKPLLASASAIYRGLSFTRRFLYNYGLLEATRLPVPVVSVGNITWGGNGKTPMVETLSGWFLGAGICPLILTRGYAGGDEAQMLQMHLQGSCAKLGVGPNRANIARSFLQSHGMQSYQHRKKLGESLSLESAGTSSQLWMKGDGKIGVVILDDGMQHLPLARNLEIVMVNAITLWGNTRMVPRGPLRESLHQLKRADVLVLHHADLVAEESLDSTETMLKQFLRKDAIVICSSMIPLHLFGLPSLEAEIGSLRRTPEHSRLPLNTLRDSVVLSVSGVGCPEALSLALERLGAHHVERMDYLDHHSFRPKDLQDIDMRCLELQMRFEGRTVVIVLTEKDYVRDPLIWRTVTNAQVLILHSSLKLISTGKALAALRELLTAVVSCDVTKGSGGR
ncbi:tetraacyldisaccharide 4'-kinase [Marchantia polymorpha subsp. ruderalis]|uniref:tetraacyldisaccharide 4'-kinase n=2 Tax=Marchantia polymorpha TaxID=3197 RepID=A0AAF6AU85_MARPO|nr:hypothetical protein MARPO_0002s0307 [Marchantia polymorpha]BBN00006.1 hypothetical protein Mp_1g25640 [Marchantia polymorpha subsp. ruderalis]|eukprot:PTQ49872.1 hypothetical protein MARPO_0002s0307 [Marchantia polymorpha]